MSKKSTLILFFTILVLWMFNLNYRKLFRPDEGRYAEISREMKETGDWVTPRLNGIKYFEKPPLQYWATTIAFELFGESEWTARLWTAICGLIGLIFVFLAGEKIFGPGVGLYSTLILGSNVFYVALGHVIVLDMGLSCFMTVVLCSMLLAQRDHLSSKERIFWMMCVWAGMALAVLSKGLVGLILPGFVLVLYTLIQRDWTLWTRLHLVPGLVLFFLITTPWFVLVSKANPEFPEFFFIHEHFARFTSKVHDRYEPWWYFGPVILGGLLPWVLFFPMSVKKFFELRPAGKFRHDRLILIWFMAITFFFSYSSSKLPPYVLPVFPALALMMGNYIHQVSFSVLKKSFLTLGVFFFVLTFFTPIVSTLKSTVTTPEMYTKLSYWVAFVTMTLAMSQFLAYWFSRNEKRNAAVIVAGLGGLLAFQLGLCGYEELSPSLSGYVAAQKIKPYLKESTPFYAVEMYEQTFPFYLKHKTILVDYRDEMGFGLDHDQIHHHKTPDTFITEWSQQTEAVVMMAKHTQTKLEGMGWTDKELLFEDPRRLVFIKKQRTTNE